MSRSCPNEFCEDVVRAALYRNPVVSVDQARHDFGIHPNQTLPFVAATVQKQTDVIA